MQKKNIPLKVHSSCFCMFSILWYYIYIFINAFGTGIIQSDPLCDQGMLSMGIEAMILVWLALCSARTWKHFNLSFVWWSVKLMKCYTCYISALTLWCFVSKPTPLCTDNAGLHKLDFKPHIHHWFVLQTVWYDATIRESNFPAPCHTKRY